MKQIYMRVNFKKTNRNQQLEIVPAIRHKTSKYSNQVEHISGESVATGVTSKNLGTGVQENQEENSKDKIYVEVFSEVQ